jgi:hypothetical protein
MTPYLEGIRVSKDFIPENENFSRLTLFGPQNAHTNGPIANFKE